MIVDSSIWIDFLGRGSTATSRALEIVLGRGELVRIVPCILQEVLQGVEDPAAWRVLERFMHALPMLRVADPADTALRAARIYAECRWQGVTPRSPNDCLIAATCIEFGEVLMHADRDFDGIARVHPALSVFRV